TPPPRQADSRLSSWRKPRHCRQRRRQEAGGIQKGHPGSRQGELERERPAAHECDEQAAGGRTTRQNLRNAVPELSAALLSRIRAVPTEKMHGSVEALGPISWYWSRADLGGVSSAADLLRRVQAEGYDTIEFTGCASLNKFQPVGSTRGEGGSTAAAETGTD